MTHDPEMTDVVRREVGEALDELLALTDRLTRGSVTSEQFVREAFRIFHNTKGALHLGGFPAPEKVAHAVEDRLAELRSSNQAPDSGLIDLMEQAMSACVYAVEGDGTHPELNLVRGKLSIRGEQSSETSARATPAESVSGEDSATSENQTAHGTIRIESERLDRLMDLGSEYLAQHSRLRRQRTTLRGFSDRFTALMKRDPKLKLVLQSALGDFENFVRSEEQELRRVTQLTADFDRAMREVRMQPLSGIVSQLRRVVAETARDLDKKAHLSTDFGEVELDREILDALREPLIHLLRNAVDHGLEDEAERARKKKGPRGEVRVSARVSGANVELLVTDDGRGLNVAKVKERAHALGLLTSVQGESDEDIIDRVLFAPGLSTADKVTSYSGRGVGLDVVRSRVAELGGSVVARANSDAPGVTFIISVPASVVSLRGLSVRAGSNVYVLPNAHVERTLRVRGEDLGSAEGSTIMRSPEGTPLRLRWLAAEMKRPREDDPDVLQVVVVSEGGQRLGLVVDEVQGDTTYVIKRLPWNLKKIPGVVGATHQGDAALALVVDLGHIFRKQATSQTEHRLKTTNKQSKLRILVADDSLTSRILERNILTEAGYDVTVEEDGQKALNSLEHAEYDLLVSDVQMPNMDGLELTRRVRAHPKLARLPIILVTSLDRPEDLEAGAQAGADEYIVKGQFDQEALLKAVGRLL